jgi:hypothetical protein
MLNNKRKHQLERVIRYEYNCFDLRYSIRNARTLLCHTSKLLEFKVWYLYDRNIISNDEKHFMLLCNNLYYIYYEAHFRKFS